MSTTDVFDVKRRVPRRLQGEFNAIRCFCTTNKIKSSFSLDFIYRFLIFHFNLYIQKAANRVELALESPFGIRSSIKWAGSYKGFAKGLAAVLSLS